MRDLADADQTAAGASPSAHAHALMTQAEALRADGRWEDALALLSEAVKTDPGSPAALHNLGVHLSKIGRLGEGEAALRQALTLAPGSPLIEHGLAHALLAQGKYKEGWLFYRARERLPGLNTGFPRDFPFPRWEGQDLSGKCLTIFPEQGLGDQIQFARFLPRLIAEARIVTLLTMKPLERLFRYNFPETDVLVADGAVEFPDPDYWTTPHDLMRVLGVELHHIPTDPYLAAPATWPSPGPGFKVGLKTQGNPRHVNDRMRSLPGDMAARLRAALPGTVVSLEPADSGAQDMADTAALIEQLDLVVSVDTSVAHLAGALGKPCLLLLPGFSPDWRWMVGRTDSRWYPNHRLFRGEINGDWRGAIDGVITEAIRRASAFDRRAGIEEGSSQHADGTALSPNRAGYEADAVTALIAAAEANPADPSVALNLGNLLTKSGRLDEGEAHCRRALALAPGDPRVAHALGTNLLAQGRLAEGWPLFAARADVPELSAKLPKGLPFARWQGEPLRGKRLAIFPEQALGDEIQFVRFLPQIVAQAAQVTLLTPPALVDLFRLNFPEADIVPAYGSTDFPDPDYWTTPSDLPHLLGVELKALSNAAYLRAAPRPATLGHGFKIGVKLRGDASATREGSHALGEADIKRLMEGLPGTIVSLEPEDLDTGNFADIAAIIHELDGVVSVDTAIAHLAGAMGRSCLLLIPGFAPDWRWMVGRNDSPWYRRHRLYRSEPDGDWTPAIDRLVKDLNRADTPGRRLMRDVAALRSEGRFLEALAVGRKALAIDANNPFTIYNVARLLTDLGELKEGEALQRRAAALAPDLPDIRSGLGLNLLAQGRYDEAWPFYEARAEVPTLNTGFPRRVSFPRWWGEDISDKRIAVFPEQGLGDALQFARLIPWLQSRSRDIVLFAAQPLEDIFRLAFPGITVVPAIGTVSFPTCDVWTTIVEMARYAGLTPNSLPAGDYLRPHFERRERADGFRIGIMTRGNPTYINDAHRSLPREAADLLRRALPGTLVELDPEISGARNFLDTAQIMRDLDLVVSVDTSVGHLAGAMGKSCLLLVNGFSTDWRWLRGRSDSPWYPEHRLFRSANTGDWGDAIARLIAEATRFVSAQTGERARPVAAAIPSILTLSEISDPSAAVERARIRVGLQPEDGEAARQLGLLLTVTGALDEGESWLRAALQRPLSVNAADRARYTLGINLLRQGRYREGWEYHRARKRLDHLKIGYPHGLDVPHWDGQPLAGKNILVMPEQGLGDQIHGARFLNALLERGATVRAAVLPPLVSLFRNSFPQVEIVPAAHVIEVGKTDYWTTFVDLLELVETEADMRPEPYLGAAAGAAKAPEGFRIGVQLAGNAGHANDRFRSLAPAQAAALRARLPGTVLGLAPEETGAKDFADTAALIDTLDLVLSVDTSVAHLAGAMGKPCLLLVPRYATDWRWRDNQLRSGWYPRHQLYYAAHDGSWDAVIEHVVADVTALAALPS